MVLYCTVLYCAVLEGWCYGAGQLVPAGGCWLVAAAQCRPRYTGYWAV